MRDIPRKTRHSHRDDKDLAWHGRLQFGALCWRRKGDQVRILLVTSRQTKRWISPKGWPMHGLPGHQAAAQEAWEEAGVRGKIKPESFGSYRYEKTLSGGRSVRCLVRMFPLKVKGRFADFPERNERKVKWMKPKKAAKLVAEPELARLIKSFARAKGKPR